MRLAKAQTLYVRSMGKALRVTAVFTEDEAANEYMARHPEEAVVAVFGQLVLLADVHDRGVRIDEAP